MKVCEYCGKKAMAGRTHRHRHSAWAQRAPKTGRWFSVNLQTVHVNAGGGTTRKVTTCTKCMKAGRTLRSV